jgi:protein-S-isoprenylcysteine O-methyltransferase Ste14
MIESFKKIAPLGKSMSYMCVILALLFIFIPFYKSIPIDFESVIGCLLLAAFWWLLGKWHENNSKDF